MDQLATLLPAGAAAVFVGAIVLGIVHGAEPGHGWPIAATYALDRPNKWYRGLLASVLLGVGHLVSSIAVVAAFFLAKSQLSLTQINDPLAVLGFRIGGPVSVVAGVLLIALGAREYRKGGHGHGHDDHEHGHHGHDHADGGVIARVKAMVPLGGGHDHPATADPDRKGLAGIVWTAFVLGFVHEEEFEIIGLCLGSTYCLELMLVYALAVMAALVGLTMLLVAGYRRYEERVEHLAGYFPAISAAVLSIMGVGFILGLL